MNKYIYITLSIILLLFSLSFVSCQENYGKIKTIPKSDGNVTIEDLIDKWDDYNIYYAGYGPRFALGVMFDPKDSDTMLEGALWTPIRDKETLVEATEWIYMNTHYLPRLNKILGPYGRTYGYLYYSYGSVVLKKTGDNKMYILDLERPQEEGLGKSYN